MHSQDHKKHTSTYLNYYYCRKCILSNHKKNTLNI